MRRLNLRRMGWFCVVLLAWGGPGIATFAQEQKKETPAENAAVKPVPRDEKWMVRHNLINDRAKAGNIDLLFIGDSITHGWEGAGKEVWEKQFGKRHPMNAGIGGDRTQHVLWRLDNGNIAGIKPKAIVIMIGTNNSNRDDHTGEEIGAGITAIVKKLRDKLPESKILVLAIFPRGGDVKNEAVIKQRAKNAKASEIASKLADGKMVHYLDIGPKFLDKDGNLPKDIMPDFLHLSMQGYQIWADSIESKLVELLGEKAAP